MTTAAARPAVSAPVQARGSRLGLGLRGLWLVLPIAALLAAGAGGPERSLRVLGPPITYALPVLVMVAFWWEDWPGTRLGPNWSGWVDTLLIAAGGVVLTTLGRAVAGGFAAPAFPATLPLGAAVFTVMLQLTLVGEGWPLRSLPARLAGPLAVALSWAAGLALYLALVRSGPVPGAELAAALVWIGAWQVLCFVVWRGRPSSRIRSRGARLACAHAVVLGGGLLSFLLIRLVADPAAATATGGCLVAAGLLVGMLFEIDRAAVAGAATLLLAAGLFAALSALAATFSFSRAAPEDWVAHASLNALAVSTILHVAVGRRRPFDRAV